MNIKEIEFYLNGEVLDNQNIQEKINYIDKIKRKKISSCLKNYLWLLKTSLDIKNEFNKSWQSLQKKEYFISWKILEQIEKEIINIRSNFDVKNNKYNLELIENTVKKLQKLYPYNLFLSPEIIVEKEKCSICGKIRDIRNGCEHIIGKIYDGEICVAIVEKCQFVGAALVEKPLQKYSVAFLSEGDHYDYSALEKFLMSVQNPFGKWNVILEKIPRYKNLKRNEKCLCGSGKKYKKCCINQTKKHIILEI